MTPKEIEEVAAESAEVVLRNQAFPIGVDYYPLDEERPSFSDWYERDVAADFAAMAEARISLVRMFVSWKVLEPQVGQYDDDAEDRLGDMIDAARAHDVRLIVSFFSDDRLAEMNVSRGPRSATRAPTTTSCSASSRSCSAS